MKTRRARCISAVMLTLILVGCLPPPSTFVAPTPTNTGAPTATSTSSPTLTASSTATPTLTPSIEPSATVVPTSTACDDFEDGIIDKTSWDFRGDETIISEKNGVLNLNVIDQSQNESAFAAIVAKLVDSKRVSEVSYTTTLVSYDNSNYGMGGIDFFLEDGQQISLGVGPGSPGLGQIEFSICAPGKSDYPDCEHPSFDIPVGDPLNIQAIASNQSMEFYINNELQQTVPISSPIANIQFYLYGDEESAFHVTVDDLCINYSGG